MRKLLILALFTSISCFGQKKVQDEWSIQFKAKSGFLVAHRGTMGHMYRDNVMAGELSFYSRVTSRNWSKQYKYPFAGITLFGSSLGNKEILGNAFGSYGFIEFPFNLSFRHVLTAKLGAGLGFLSRVYDPIKDPKNVAMSSHVNALICLGIQGRWYLTKKDVFTYGLDMTHLSNGATKVPNLGVNLPFISLGYARVIKAMEIDTITKYAYERTPFFRSWSYSPIGIASFKENFPYGGKRYPVYAISNVFYKQFRPKVGMEIALDFISKQALFGYRDYIPKTQWSIFQIGTYLGYAIPLDKLRFVIGMGYYVKDRYDADDEFYHRVGMRYQAKNGLMLNLVLKSHWAKADYIEFGLGYTFKNKTK